MRCAAEQPMSLADPVRTTSFATDSSAYPPSTAGVGSWPAHLLNFTFSNGARWDWNCLADFTWKELPETD